MEIDLPGVQEASQLRCVPMTACLDISINNQKSIVILIISQASYCIRNYFVCDVIFNVFCQ